MSQRRASPDDQALPPAPGAPRSRAAILAAVATLLGELVEVGLSHLSRSMTQRLRTLAVSASAVHFPRLGLALREAADEIELLITRSAHGDEARLLTTLARLDALVAALRGNERPTKALVGTFRSRYEDVGELVLTGLGAYRWRTRSGYRGLTLVFLEENAGRWYTWSDSRPERVDPAFEPLRRYFEEPPWKGAGTPARTSRHRLRLTAARVNDQGRLSSTGRCTAEELDPTRPTGVDFGAHHFTDWGALRARAASTMPIGLAVPEESSSLVIVEPARWGQVEFDELEQTLAVTLFDAAGDAVPLRVPFAPINEGALRRLETVAASPRGVRGICARLHLHREGVVLYPLSLLLSSPDPRGAAVVNLTLDPLPAMSGLGHLTRRELEHSTSGVGGDVDEVRPLPRWPPPTEAEVADLEETLQRLAESGRRALDDITRKRLQRHARSLRDQGLPILAEAADAIALGPARGSSLLRLRYLCDLHRQNAVRATVESGRPAPPAR